MARNDQNVLSTRADLGHDLEWRGVVEGYGNKFSVRGYKVPYFDFKFSIASMVQKKNLIRNSTIPGRDSYTREGVRSLRSSFYTLICIDMQRNMLFLRNFFLIYCRRGRDPCELLFASLLD